MPELHYAAQRGDLAVLTKLVRDENCNISLRDACGKTALHEAVIYGHYEAAKLLLESGCAVDSLKRADWTPLMCAASKANNEICELLIKHGANGLFINKDGWTALHIAVRANSITVVQMLIKNFPSSIYIASNNKRLILHTAAYHGHVELCKLFINDDYFAIDSKDSSGITPLFYALMEGHTECANILISKGARVDLTDNLGRHIFHLIALEGRIDSYKYVKDSFPYFDENIKDLHGRHSIHYASMGGHVDFTNSLIVDNPRLLQLVDDFQRTPMCYASLCRQKQLENWFKYLNS